MTNLTFDALRESFGPLAGRRVAMTKIVNYKDGKPLDEVHEPALPKEGVMQALEDLTTRLGIEYRLVLPHSMMTMEFKPDRLNVHIVRDAKNEWYIGQIVTDDRRVVASTLLQTTAADLATQEKISVRKPLAIKRPHP